MEQETKSSAKGIVGQLLILMIATALCFGALEGFVRVMGWGKADPDSSVLFYQQINFPLFEAVTLESGEKVYRAKDDRLWAQQFSFQKDPQTFRVFVFGGSATKGLGFSSNVTFSHYLQEFLSNIYPEQKIEVINCGIIGFSTKQVKAMVDHVQKNYDPDVLVVYEANNEFLELHARMFMDHKLNARVLRMQDSLNHSHLYRAMKGGIQSLQARGKKAGGGSDEKFSQFAFSESEIMSSVKVSGEEYQFVEQKFRKNLQDIVKASHDTPLMLLTVSSNLRWNDPDDLQGDWVADYLHDHHVTAVVGQPMDRQAQLLKTLALLQGELRKTVSPPDAVHFRLGKVYEEMGNPQRAREEYELARDLDPRSRRALGQFNRSILQWTKVAPHVEVIDTEAVLAAHVPKGIIGYESFYDYVHFTPAGAQRVAEAIARRMVEDQMLAKVSRNPQPYDFDGFVRTYADDLRRRSIDYPESDRWIGFNFDKATIASTNLFKYTEGIKSLESMVKLGRQDPWIYAFLGNAHYYAVGKEDETEQNYREALRLVSESDDELRRALLKNLTTLYKRRGKDGQANQALAVMESLHMPKGDQRAALDKFLRNH